MADITRATNRGFDVSLLSRSIQLPGFEAGEDLLKMDVVRIGSDGKVYKAASGSTVFSGSMSGSVVVVGGSTISACAVNLTAYAGFTYIAVKKGDIVTIIRNAGGTYSASMTPGTFLWISSTSGSLADQPARTWEEPVAQVLTATKILVL